jgi:hypothetical protein
MTDASEKGNEPNSCRRNPKALLYYNNSCQRLRQYLSFAALKRTSIPNINLESTIHVLQVVVH